MREENKFFLIKFLEGSAITMLCLLHFFFISLYFVPCYNGVDPNGYHVAAKIFAAKSQFSYLPYDEASFVGRMWVINDKGWAYAKYPPFYPLLCASAIRIFGNGADFYINPLCATLSVLGIYLLARLCGFGLWSLLAAFMLAFLPVPNVFALRQVSHSSSLFFIIYAYIFVFASIRKSRTFISAIFALLGGLFIGFSAGIRYTDIMLCIPPLILFYEQLRKKNFLSLILYLSGIAVPVLYLAFYHWQAFGKPWLTGYALTGEQSGFAFSYFKDNIRFYISGILKSGLGPIALLSVFGFIILYIRSKIKAIFYGLWIFPAFLLYSSYYWAPEANFAGFLRFLIPIMPACIMLAVYFIKEIAYSKISTPILRIAFVVLPALIYCAWGILEAIPQLESQLLSDLKQFRTIKFIMENAQGGSVIISSNEILNYLDYEQKFILYTEEVFNQPKLKRLTERADIEEPAGLQKARAKYLKENFADLKSSEFNMKVGKILEKHLDAQRPVLIALNSPNRQWMISGLFRNYEIEKVAEFKEELPKWRILPPVKFSTIEKQKKTQFAEIYLYRIEGGRKKKLLRDDENIILRERQRELISELKKKNPELQNEIDELITIQKKLMQNQNSTH